MPYLKYRESSHINSLEFYQNEYPKTPFSHFLKYGENKEIHVFTIDNTIALKNNVHNSGYQMKTTQRKKRNWRKKKQFHEKFETLHRLKPNVSN